MKTKTLHCIILGHKNLGEADKLVFLYNEEFGKIKAIARGARKITSKFTSQLETLCLCTATLYFGPHSTIITEISGSDNRPHIQHTLEGHASALQIAEITNEILPENQSLTDLIKLIEKAVIHLSKSAKPDLISIAYIIKLLDKAGLIPDFRDNNDFSLEKKYRKFFQFLKNSSFSEIEKISLKQKEKTIITSFLKDLIHNETSREFKSFIV